MKLQCKLLLLLILASAVSMAIYAQNHMPLMTTLYGEFRGDKYGSQMIAMDYNGDGYDDLIVLSDKWNASGELIQGYYPGKLYFYWGSPEGLSTTPDFVLEGQQQNDYSSYNSLVPSICNAGDMNGDGIDDLAISRSYDGSGGTNKSLNLYLGRPVPQTEPDYIITYPQTELYPRWLGDVNNDGKADLAINGQYSNYRPFCYIWTDLDSDPILFRTNMYRGSFLLNGVGDVNNDGYGDSFMTTPLSLAGTYPVDVVLYYGDASVSMTDSLIISESRPYGLTNARPLGDINGDGFDDFIGYLDTDYHYIWLGSTELDSIPDLQLSRNTNDHDMRVFGRNHQAYAVYGDMNGDGYSDFVCSDRGANGWNGQAGLWLGGPNINTTVDLVLDPPPDWTFMNFGHAKAVGDFNGDGYDDLALSCPWWREGSSFTFTGRVYVYAGNAQLQDTTVANDDPVAPPPGSFVGEISVFPNPAQISNNVITIKMEGEAYSRSGNYSYRLYNIRGQKIRNVQISNANLDNRAFEIMISDLSVGIYQIVVLFDGHQINTKRIIVY